ncbi:GNAT family N-acetyltransferase [Litorisediminicola beolgyonensis]|uniref:GNAT family N-acetyltransferase n=2 Tax=Litorisediminicola beolgyonensis TaxID=1173614 RepID=A0ABW3ZFX5_9RHOB
MEARDLARVLDWAAEEGWNPGHGDAAAFHAADPGGFFLAEEDGAPVAAISVVNHGADFAFLGLYLCRPSHRGLGIGFDLWTHALARAGGRTVGLDGVPAQQENYARSGFVLAGGTARSGGQVQGAVHEAVRSARPAELPAFVAAEGMASGVVKPDYLGRWLRGDDTRVTLVAEAPLGFGFATVRQCREGAKIGPLLAETVETAEALIRHAATLYPGPVFLDVPERSAPLAELCGRLGLAEGFRTARMYRGRPVIQTADIFAVTSLELG